MKVEPAGRDLIDIARATILEQIVPALPESRRYAALMAANALAIAARDLAAPEADREEIARIAALLGDWVPDGDAMADLRDGTALLAARVREGRFDEGPARARLAAFLRDATAARLAVSNPKVLDRQEGKPP